MAGSGSILVATAIGRNVICVELEEKFCVMMRQNWEKIKSLGPFLGFTVGEAVILQGDSRNLDGLLATHCIFSPPYSASTAEIEQKFYAEGRRRYKRSPNCQHFGTEKYGKTDGQIGNLPYGSISAIVSSPPHGNRLSDKAQKDNDPQRMSYQQALNKISVACFSPPYEAQSQAMKSLDDRKDKTAEFLKKDRPDSYGKSGAGSLLKGYSPAQNNIGNLKSSNYLEAMALVYQGCHQVLRDRGLLILVVKNFVRKGQVIRLDSDTIRLCENAGFLLKERLKRRLTQMSFWRTLEKKRWEKQGKQYPEDMSFEHILVFEKK
jgi:tRNA G10  N-methylase Trm11